MNNLELDNIDWVIVGGELGFKVCLMKKEWVDDVYKRCKEKEVLFFFK